MKIKTSETNLENFFNGLSTRYWVPKYQRDYSWTVDEIEQLWSDLTAAFKSASQNYFVGTLVLNEESHQNNSQEDHFDIVDGQQRLATISIIFCVIRNIGRAFSNNPDFLPQFARSDEFKKIATKIYGYAEDRLLHRSEPDNYYLELNEKDHVIFRSNIQNFSHPSFDPDSLRIIKNENRLLKAKKTISKNIQREFLDNATTIDSLYKFLVFLCQRLQFIKIVVATDYDAYLLFESLNSKGLDLTTADLVKNKLLAVCGTDGEKRKRVIDSWDAMISKLPQSRFQNPVDFLRFYWIAYTNTKVTKRDLYKEIRNKLQEHYFDVEKFMSDLSARMDDFILLTDSKLVWPSSDISTGSTEQYLAEMNTLRYAIHIPAFLAAIKFRPRSFVNLLSKKSLSFLFRLMTIGDYGVGAADAVFSNVLTKLICSPEATAADILSCFDVEHEKIGDDAFKQNFQAFRSEDNHICRYILSKIHVYQSGSEQIPKKDEINLEHVLPQNSEKWEAAGFSCDGGRIEDLIYSIGNMTLLNKALNASASNRVFSEKIENYQKRETQNQIGTTFPMTYRIYDSYVNEQKEWTKDTIFFRAKTWADISVSIWEK